MATAVTVPFRLGGIDHVVLRVRDRQVMLDFYRDVLGCTLEREQAEIGLTQLRAGQSLIDFVDLAGKLGRMGGAGPGKEGRNVDHICLAISPFDEAAIRAHLRQYGVSAGETGSRYGAGGEGPSIYLQDPEDNTIELKAAERG
ncbi:MAG TPA: VOC family protein [Dongiaceae bacterium]|nr:VOC family protein [Dongiaceae bacterium]